MDNERRNARLQELERMVSQSKQTELVARSTNDAMQELTANLSINLRMVSTLDKYLIHTNIIQCEQLSMSIYLSLRPIAGSIYFSLPSSYK